MNPHSASAAEKEIIINKIEGIKKGEQNEKGNLSQP
jgi:hypothetical protein